MTTEPTADDAVVTPWDEVVAADRAQPHYQAVLAQAQSAFAMGDLDTVAELLREEGSDRAGMRAEAVRHLREVTLNMEFCDDDAMVAPGPARRPRPKFLHNCLSWLCGYVQARLTPPTSRRSRCRTLPRRGHPLSRHH